MGDGCKGGIGLLSTILGTVMGGGEQKPASSVSTQRTAGPAGVRQTGRAAQDELANFSATVFAYTENAWHAIFMQEGLQYHERKLVLFDGVLQSACGMGQAAIGPFYCPGDQKVCINPSFYRDLKE